MREIHLFDLPRELRVRIKDDYRKELFTLAQKKAGSRRKLADVLGTKPKNVQRWKNGKRLCSIEYLKRLISFLEINNTEELEKKITEIKLKRSYIKNPKLPIKICEDLGIVIGGVLGDGGVSHHYVVHYSNTKVELIKSFKESVENVFGNVQVRKVCKGRVMSLFFSAILGKILVFVFGAPKGDKTRIDYEIPKVIFESDINTISKFLQRLFDDEAYVDTRKSGRRIIISTRIEKDKVTNNGPKRFQDMRELFKMIGIKCGKPTKLRESIHFRKGNDRSNKKPVTVEDWGLIIYNKKNLQIFAKRIGFKLEYKMQALIETINSIKLDISPKNEYLSYFFKNAKELYLKNKRPFSSKELAIKSNRKRSRTQYALQKLREMGLIKQIRPTKNTSKGSMHALYVIPP